MPQDYTLIGGNGTVVSPLEATEDGTYKAGDSRAFNPVIVRTGGGGSSTLAGLTDVDLTNPTDGQTLVYDATAGKWVNGSGGGGFTLLQGTYDNDEITLSVTAAELFALLQTGGVVISWSYADEDIVTHYSQISSYGTESESGNVTAYFFSTANFYQTVSIAANEFPVFSRD